MRGFSALYRALCEWQFRATWAAQKGSVAVAFLNSHYPGIELVETANHLLSLVAVAQGDVDAAVLLLPVSRYLINQYFSKDLRVITSLPQLQSTLGFAVVKDQPLLFGVMEGSLKQIEPRLIGKPPVASPSLWRVDSMSPSSERSGPRT